MSIILVFSGVLLCLLTPSSAADRNLMIPGESLGPGQSLTAGNTTLTMTESCNLEMIHNGNKIWELHAARESTADCLLYMQLRGVLALYAKTMNRLLWESNQAKGWTGGLGFRNYIFVLRPDGVATVLGNATLLDDNTLSGVTVWSTAA